MKLSYDGVRVWITTPKNSSFVVVVVVVLSAARYTEERKMRWLDYFLEWILLAGSSVGRHFARSCYSFLIESFSHSFRESIMTATRSVIPSSSFIE